MEIKGDKGIDLKGKLVIITGGTGAIGRVIVRTLAGYGADVAINYFSNEKLANQLTDEVKAMGRHAMAVQADVTDLNAVMEMRDKVKEKMGSPDIVINNAMTKVNWKSVLESGIEDYQAQFMNSVIHTVSMAKAFIPDMMEKRYGRFIGLNTESIMLCNPKSSTYVAGKRGMDGVMRVLAKEVGEYGITVNQVAPGWTVTERTNTEGTTSPEEYIKRVPLKRRGTDRDIANVVAFVASDLADFITGAYIPVSGGIVMPCT